MAVASLACWAVASLLLGGSARGPALLGMLGPLAVAAATWMLVQRTHEHSPGRVSGLMIKLFAAKMALVGAYVAVAVMLLQAGSVVAFVVSFTCHYVLLHLMEAFYLRRLFSDGTALGTGH